jgi:hypothetical protein
MILPPQQGQRPLYDGKVPGPIVFADYGNREHGSGLIGLLFRSSSKTYKAYKIYGMVFQLFLSGRPPGEILSLDPANGTRRMLELAAEPSEQSRLRRFAYIETAFVAGEQHGKVLEAELDRGWAFTDTYKRSKFKAEQLVRSYLPALPITILRPSVVADRSDTGSTTSCKVLYWPVEAFARRLVLCIAGDPESSYDFVPVGFVAKAVLQILACEATIGACFHLSSGRNLTLRRAVEITAEEFGVTHPPFISPKWDPQALIDQGVPEGYRGFCTTEIGGRVCGKPGHVRHFPGSRPYTGAWCDEHYTGAAQGVTLGPSLVLAPLALVLIVGWLAYGCLTGA